jgi:ABC-type polysaccharide/polyol phosphate transport system ATPase subunit
MTPIIKASGLGKRYRPHQPSLVRQLANWTLGRSPKVLWALRDLNLEVNPGEALAILGRNGSGKSTLLKLISGVTQPSSGSFQRRGRIASLLELGAGFHPELTGRDNVYVNGALLGLSHAEVRARFDRIVAFSGLESFIDTPVKWYSSGMYLRLGFAVAAHMQADCLLVDEVLAVGDLDFRIRCYDRIEQMRREGTTLIYVSHDLWSVQRLCTRALLLEQGRTIAQGDAVEVIERYQQREAQMSAAPASGSHLTIQSVDLLAADGTRLLELDRWGSLWLRVRFQANRPMDALVFVVRLYTGHETICSTLSDHHLPTQTYTGPSQRQIQLKDLPLVAGEYFIAVDIADRNYPVVYSRGHSALFHVRGKGSSPSQIGALDLQAMWQ